jgi:glycosyltransferase involved in cell wall biosynthesis
MSLISVVIPVRDSEATLGACLESLEKQEFRDFEVIVVDGGSRDGTRELARSRGALVLRFSGSVPAARNIGFSKASGRILFSMDSDMLAGDGLLGEIAEKIGPGGFDALVIPELGAGKGFLSRCKSFEKRCYLGKPAFEAARAFSRGCFDSAGGYDPDLHLSEDWDLHARMAGKSRIGRSDSVLLHDTGRLGLLSDLRKSYRYGRSMPRFMDKQRSESRAWLRGRESSFGLFLSKWADDPPAALGLVILKSMEYACGAAGFLASKAGL